MKKKSCEEEETICEEEEISPSIISSKVVKKKKPSCEEEEISRHFKLLSDTEQNIIKKIETNKNYAKTIIFINLKKLQGKYEEITPSNLKREVFKSTSNYSNNILTAFVYWGLLKKINRWESSKRMGIGLKPNIYTINDFKLLKDLVKIAKKTLEEK